MMNSIAGDMLLEANSGTLSNFFRFPIPSRNLLRSSLIAAVALEAGVCASATTFGL